MQWLSLAPLVLLLAPVQDPGPAPSPAPAAQAPAPATAAPEDEAALAPFRTLAAELQSALEKGAVAELERCIDLDSLLLQATTGIDRDSQFSRGFRDGVRTTLLPSLVETVHVALEKGSGLRLLRIRPHGVEFGLLFRLLVPAGGFGYIEFMARADAEGRARAHDWIAFSQGERASETLHRMFLPLAVQKQRGLLERLLGRNQLMAQHWSEIERLVAAVSEQRVADGLAIYGALPEELRREKFLLLQRVQLVQPLEDTSEYQRALEDFRRFHPDDPATEVQSIDYFYMRKRFKRAAESVRRLRRSVAGDPYLDHLEGSLHLQDGDLERARECAEYALKGEPELLQIHWGLVSVCLRQQDHARVLVALEAIDKLFEVQWSDFEQVEEYKGFAAAPEHAEWKRYLAAKQK